MKKIPESNFNPNYRAEIDGLRAIAVLAVIINHCRSEFLPSGFLGVDIFYVISGFVVTASLSAKNDLSWSDYLKGFYSRRMKRLLPALAVCVVLSAFLGSLFIAYPGESLFAGIASLVGISNIYLFSQSSNYFGQAAELNLFTQTWSLGVEEQFYFLFPFLLALTGFSRKKTELGSDKLFWWLLFTGLVSLFLFVFFHSRNNSAAFYLMPMRFWELAIGSLCFICNRNDKKNYILSILSFIGLLIILFFPITFQPFSTIIAVFMTSGILLTTFSNNWVKYFLSRSIFVKIGQLSYSIYLWHWPILVIARYTIKITPVTTPLLLILMFIFSYLSYHFIERPWRNKQFSDNKTILLSLITIIICILFLLAIGKPLKGKLFTGNILPPIVEAFKGESGEAKCRWDYKSDLNNYNQLMNDCIINNNNSNNSKTLFITGDSHAEALGNLTLSISEKLKFGINLKTAGGCLFPASFIYTYEGMGIDKIKECQHFQKLRLQEIMQKAKFGDIVLNVNYYGHYLTSPTFNDPKVLVKRFNQNLETITLTEAQEKYAQDLLLVAQAFKEKGIRFIILAPQLQFKKQLKDCTFQWFNFVSSKERDECTFKKSDLLNHRKNIMKYFFDVTSKSDIIIWDPIELLCPKENCDYYDQDNNGYFADRDHYSGEGARFLAKSLISLLMDKGLVEYFPADN